MALNEEGGPGPLNPSSTLLIINPYLSLCLSIKGTGYGAERGGRARTVESNGAEGFDMPAGNVYTDTALYI